MYENNFIKKLQAKFGAIYKTDLIQILNFAQEEYGSITKDMISIISKNLNIPEAKIFGIITYYSEYKIESNIKYRIKICDGITCHLKQKIEIINEIENYFNIKINESKHDAQVSLESSQCFGACSTSPNLKVNNTLYTNIDLTKTKEIIKNLKKD